jgi:hypothetical protein
MHLTLTDCRPLAHPWANELEGLFEALVPRHLGIPLKQGRGRMLAAKAVSQFKKDGYFVIPGVIDAVLNLRLGAFVAGLANHGAGSRSLLDEAWCTFFV